MKKAIVCLLAILLILAFVSCNATPDSGSSSAGTTTEPSTGSETIPEATLEQVKTVNDLLTLASTAANPSNTLPGVTKNGETDIKYTDVSISDGKLNGSLKTIIDEHALQLLQNLTFQKGSVKSSYEGTIVLKLDSEGNPITDIDSKFVATVNGVKCMMDVSVVFKPE